MDNPDHEVRQCWCVPLAAMKVTRKNSTRLTAIKSSTGSRLVTTGQDDTTMVWDASNGNSVLTSQESASLIWWIAMRSWKGRVGIFATPLKRQRQTVMLTMALVGVKQYPKLRGPSRAYLHVLGTKHSGRGIAQELYSKFVEVLVETIAEFHGDDWSESLDKQWTDALNLAVATMHEGRHD